MTSTATPVTLHQLLGRFHFGVTLVAVALSGLTVFFAGVAALRGYTDRNLELASQLGAYSIEPALVFGDPQAAREAIAPLGKVAGIGRVVVYDANGNVLAQWQRPTPDPAPAITRLFLARPLQTRILRNGTTVGQIELSGDSTALWPYVRAGLLGGLACLLLTAVGTIFIARRFEAEITGHIGTIAAVARDVRLHRRFDRRVEAIPVIELNRLGKDVNALLDELDGWHSNLAQEKAQLSKAAMQDRLTSLPNRAALDAHFEQLTADPAAMQKGFSLLYLDIDRFKATNDRFGHRGGDAVLTAVAARLRETADTRDMVARLGGDEFIVVTAPGRTGETAEMLARMLQRAIAAPVPVIEGVEQIPSVSIGVAHYPGDGRTTADLLNHADMAMYRAKQGRDGGARR
jgi:diguanylate cyclase